MSFAFEEGITVCLQDEYSNQDRELALDGSWRLLKPHEVRL
jgi:hypothetical protein